ncbi:GNAT family N-acetyltransferase [Nakamurella endophytica]|uniref:Aminoglycoside N-acetyltransferase AAC(2')-Ie n=1 Tax=Nakamurella endophytica TaxID=1748367 RepID=A0A917WLS8_9ACTN|nr:GNAT family N-acetyltransferase [Nakamurella endophytica]GGM14237.1 aminoglycoside N-acetyltransferase AAC(2')-Ie [Nakamurella endophytica]
MTADSALWVGHTAQLPPDLAEQARAVCDRAFAGDFDDADWAHALGGLHALVLRDGRVLAHGALVARGLWHAGRPLRAGYVEAVAVDPDHRRRGHGGAVLAVLEDAARRVHQAGALSTSDAGRRLYLSRGWVPWRGPTAVLEPGGVRRTPDDDDAVLVLPGTVPLDPDRLLVCDGRDGDPW